MEFVVIYSTFLPVILVLAVVTAILSFFKSPWFKGFAGEMLVHISAKIHLRKDKYHVLRNITLPTADGTTQIDHIIVSEYGVFVIETKYRKGWIFGDAHQRTWTQKIFKHTNIFQNPLHQNHKHVATLKAFLELNDQQIFSVVAFVGNCTFKTEMPDNVVNGSGLIRYIKSKDRQVILSTDVPMVLAKIEAERLMPSWETSKKHREHVRAIVEAKQKGTYCSTYKTPMVEGKAKSSAMRSQQFFSCSKSTECRETAAVTVEDEAVEIWNGAEPGFIDSWGNKTWRDEEHPGLFRC